MDLHRLAQICAGRQDKDTPTELDVDTLLVRVHLLSTKLALNPASAHIQRDLIQHASALAHTARRDNHGATLAKLTRDRVSGILDALGALASALIGSTQDHLTRIATLHDLIDSARGPSGFPKDNQAAVCLVWKSDCDSLQDNLQEITTIISQAESPPDNTDDGWDELGLANATHLDEDELARTKKVHQLLRLTTLLHKRIFLDLLPFPSSAPLSAFDDIVQQSSLLLSTSDDLVAALYAPQDLDHVRDHILHIANITTSLQTQTTLLLPPTDQLQALTLNDGPPAKKRADKKWFDTCVDQILRLSSRLADSSDQTENPTSQHR